MSFDKIKKVTQGKFPSTQNGVLSELEISKVYPNPNQPRKEFTGIEELGASIKQDGLLQPIVVVKTDDGYMIIAGERRYRASLWANLKTIRAIILDADDKKVRELSLIENIQREDLSDYEIAKFINELWDSGHYKTKKDLAAAIKKPQSYLSKAFSAVKLSEAVVKDLEETKPNIGLEVLQELSGVKDADQQMDLYKKGATRQEIREVKKPKSEDSHRANKFKKHFELDDLTLATRTAHFSNDEVIVSFNRGFEGDFKNCPVDKKYKITIEEI